MDYGLGAVFGCPAHDQRDLDFANKYNLSVKTVVTPEKDDLNFKVTDEAYTGSGYIFNSSFLNGLKCPDESIIKTIELLEEKILGEKKINFRLKDWGILVKDTGVVRFQLFMMKIIILKNYQKKCFLLNFQKLIN